METAIGKWSLDRRTVRRIVILFVCAMIAAFAPVVLEQTAHAAGTTYYVGGSGASDSNPGTSSQPYATIQKAATVAAAGDTVRIRSGTYRETITPTNSGGSGNPIVYEPDTGAVVTVSGADAANGGWSVYSGNIYRKSITMTNGYNANMTNNTTLLANQVFVDGQMMIEARWPNLPDSNDLFDRTDARDGNLATWSTSGSQTVTDSGIPSISGGWAGGTIWVNGWFISQTRSITAQSGSTLTLSGGIIGSDTKLEQHYYLTGRLGALDTAKEFFYDGTYLYLWAPGGGSPANVEVKKRNYAFDLSGRSYITIRNINLFAASITSNTSSTNITLDGLNAKYINHGVTLTDSDVNYSHTGQILTGVGATGIRLMGANSVIRNSEVSFGSSMGIVLGANGTASNNLVHDIDYEGTYASAIAPMNGTDGQKITNNTIYRTGRSAIDLRESENVEIGYNDMYNFGELNQDMGAIYSWGNAVLDGLRIHHNWIHDSSAQYGAEGIQVGIYFDQGSGISQSDHNVLWNNVTADYYVEHTSSADVQKIFNNTFATQSYASYVTYQNTALDNMKNNIFRDDVINYNPSTTSIFSSTDPKFTGTGTGGLAYRLQSSSPAKDTGAVISGVTDGYVGSAPDIGAYEYGGTDWVPGYVAPSGGPFSVNDTVTGTGQNQFEYAGSGWGSGASAGAYQDDEHYSGTTNDYYQFDFTGTQIQVYAQKYTSSGIAAISIDGGTETNVDLYSASLLKNTLIYTSPTLSAGSHTVKVRVTGTHNASSSAYWVVADRIVVTPSSTTTVNDTVTGTGQNQFEYVGSGWGSGASTGAHQDDEHYSGTTNDYYQFDFTGTKVQVYAQKYTSSGIAAISIDGGTETNVDLYNASLLKNTLIYTSPTLSAGSHTVKVRVTGTHNASSSAYWVVADRIVVTS